MYEVEAVVDDRAFPGELHVLADHGHQVHAPVLGGKADDRRRSPERGRGGGALEGICVDDASGRELLNVGVRVDATGQHQPIRGVDLGGTGRQVSTDRGDHPARYRDVGIERIDRGTHTPPANDAIVLGPLASLAPVLSALRWTMHARLATMAGNRGGCQMASHARRRILVVNPNSNEVVTEKLADALRPITFKEGPQIVCVTLKEGPYGIETQEHVESVTLPLRRLVAGSNDVDAFVIACYSDPGLYACREATVRPCSASTRRASYGTCTGRALRRRRHRPALDPAALRYLRQMGLVERFAGERPLNMSVAETASGEDTLNRMIEVGRSCATRTVWTSSLWGVRACHVTASRWKPPSPFQSSTRRRRRSPWRSAPSSSVGHSGRLSAVRRYQTSGGNTTPVCAVINP